MHSSRRRSLATQRGGVLFPIVLSIAKGAGSEPDSEKGRRLGGYLMFCTMAGLAVSSALWLTATSCNPIGVQIAQNAGFKISFGSWLLATSVPTLTAMLILPLLVSKLFPPGVGATPEAPAAARSDLAGMGSMGRDEWITLVIFAVMVGGWVFGNALNLNGTAVAFIGFGALLVTGVLTLADISKQGDTLVTFLWLAVLFALSAQLNELGFMGYVGERLALRLDGLSLAAPCILRLDGGSHVGLHYFFVSQTSQVLALARRLPRCRDSRRGAGCAHGLGLLFASSYFSVITPQGGSQNVIFVASGYLKQGELYKLGLLVTLAFMAVYLLVGTPWLLFLTR